MKINIAGDFVITSDYKIDTDLIDLFGKSDFNLVNLEAPVTSSTSTIIKTGPHIKSDYDGTKRALQKLDIDLVTLANNHVLDYDEQGVLDTLAFCNEYKIDTVGAGATLEEASKTYYYDSEEGRIAIINFAENEWASAKKNAAGANPMDLIDNAKQIQDSKTKADFVFVIIHGGHEYYNLPSPRMQKQYRYYAECGADLVVAHHTHCISGFEVHKNVPIYYSLGNFLFTTNSKYVDWYTGLVLEVELKDKKIKTKIHPVRQSKDTFELRLLRGEEKETVQERFDSYSNTIQNQENLMKEWNRFIELKYPNYIYNWSPMSFIKNRYVRAILGRLRFNGLNSRGVAILLNMMRCEAHADLSKAVTQKYLNEK